MIKRVLAPILVAAALATPASADSMFSEQSGIAVGVAGALGVNSDDDATDFGGTHPMTALQLSYRLHTGTEAFATGGLGAGGHEAVFATWGVGVRQRVRLGAAAPYVELGLHEVGDDQRLALAVGAGAGLDVQLTERMFVGASGGHYFSDDSDELGGLDWYARAHASFLLGGGYRRAQ